MSRARRLLPFLLCAIYVGQCSWFIGTQSLTMDEPLHLWAGLDAWQRGAFKRFSDHPPLPRLFFTIPLVGRQGESWGQVEAGLFPRDPEEVVWKARAMNASLGLLLALLVWMTARRLFSEAAANVALGLFVFSPSLVAHFSLATTDGAGTLAIFAAAAQLDRWRRDPSGLETVILGAVLGGLLAAKLYTAPLFILALGLVLILGTDATASGPRSWNWRKALAVGAIAFLILWGTYFFHVTAIQLHDGRLIAFFPENGQWVDKPFPLPVNATLLVPAAEYVSALVSQVRHQFVEEPTRPSFFVGEVARAGRFRFYFPVAIALKWPTVVLVLALVAATLMATRRLAAPSGLLPMLAFPAVFLTFALFSTWNIGDRHVLPLYPFALLLAGGCWEAAWQRRWARGVLVVALCVNAADTLRYAPDDLSYFNAAVAPEESYRLLTDSSLDWGQGLLALRKYEAAHPQTAIHLAYFGPVQPSLYGIRALPLGEREHACGTVIVSATHLSGQALRDPTSYRWLLRHPRTGLLNHTLHVFEVPASECAGGALPAQQDRAVGKGLLEIVGLHDPAV